jgi:hypothetical protein
MTPDKEMALEIANRFASRMCDEHGETHGEELYCMGMTDIVEAINFVATKEREACAAILDANAMACHSPIMRSLLQSNAQAIKSRGQA